jgi:SAM-dependent methyltransferase
MIPLILLALCCVSLVAVQESSVAPTPEQLKAYEAFRAWVTQQPPDMQKASDDEVFRRYAAELKGLGSSEADAAATIELIKKLGDRAEIERWNRILTSPKAPFSRSPNAFLVEMIKGVKPGRSLDVGMGQGRNTIYLAQQGWDSVGFDPADRAVAAAQQQATAAGVKITTQVAREEDFDWGNAKWDLIVLSYVGARAVAGKTTRALRPGGMVIVEAFHRDATRDGPVGGAVVFDTNELLQLFKDFRVIRYEDAKAVSDFGLTETRVVRLAAIKP